jgi:hypothetical protein
MLNVMSSRARRDAADAGIDADAFAITDSFQSLTAQHDFIRPLAQLIQDGLKLLFETSSVPLMSKENVERFQLTLTDAASIIEEAILAAESDDNPLKMHVAKTFAAEVKSIIVEVVEALEALKANGCTKDRHSVSSSTLRDYLLECEVRLRRKFEDLNKVFSPHRFAEMACTNKADSLHCCHDGGGLATLQNEDHVDDDEKIGEHSRCSYNNHSLV